MEIEQLHHAIDERRALKAAWQALRPRGVAIAAEPGVGHSKAAREFMKRYDVTDRDMPLLDVESSSRPARPAAGPERRSSTDP
jgi:hypothetical protein